MKVLLTGGTGYIGRHLVRALLDRDASCTVVSRGNVQPWPDERRVRVLRADPTQPGDWQTAVADADVVVNLAGAVLVDPPHRWTKARKAVIWDSRVETTTRLAEAIGTAARAPQVFVSGSAVGYYGSRGDDELGEDVGAGSDFLASLCQAWERAAHTADDATRVVCARTGLVLGRDSPLLHSMVPPFKLGVGGPWGSGKQWWPWVHVADVVRLMLFAIDGDLVGPLNVAAPHPVRVREFAHALGHALGRPAFARVPAIVLRVGLGEVADALLASQCVVPARALNSGFQFRFPDLASALEDIFERRS